MPSGIFWLYTNENKEDRVLIGHPAAFCDTPDEAKTEGRKVLAELPGVAIRPATVGNFSSLELGEVTDEITQNCEEVYLGPDEEALFYDVTDLRDWASKDWWPLKPAA